MEMKDYYAELGIAPDASDQAIKKAYRKLAREYHPDVNAGDASAEQRFKSINEAYQTLGDAEKRKKYDTLREQYRQWQQYGGPGGPGYNAWQSGPGASVYTTGNLSPEDLEQIFGSDSPFVDMFGSMFGQQTGPRMSRPHRGQDVEVLVEMTLEEAFSGTLRTLQVGENRIEARIPPGVYTGSRVRLAGQGSPGVAGGSPGDLYLLVQIADHPWFERNGHDLTTEVRVDLYTAAIGGEVRVTTLDGVVRLKIPPRTQADRTFRLRGKGMPHLDRPQERGDLYARVKLVLPDDLSESELDTLRELARNRQFADVSWN